LTSEKQASTKRLPTALRALVMGSAAGLLAWPLTVGSGVTSAILGAFAGTAVGERAARSRARTPSLLVLAALFAAAGTWVARALVASSAIAGILGPLAAVALSEALFWAFLIAPGVFALRLLAVRVPACAAFEVLAVGGVLALTLAVHRQGRVHRPLTLGDWAWSQGIDPALVFLVFGGLASFLLAALLISERRVRRVPLHFAALFAIAIALLFLVRVGGLPKPRPSADLGLTGDPAEAKEEGEDGAQGGEGEEERRARPRRGGGGGGEGTGQFDDMEFRDEYSSSGNEAPVAMVLLHDDYSPPSGVYYFRQTAFSQYNGRRLVQATRRDVDADILRYFPSSPFEVPEAPPVSERRKDLRTTIGLLIDHVRPFALDSPAALRPVENPNPMRFQRALEVVSHVQTLPYQEMIGQRPGAEDWDEKIWRHYTEAPSDPRYGELASEMVAQLQDTYRTDPLAQALAVKHYLDKNGIYSRRSTHAEADDPTASFLFGDLTGYCVHFAHAATYLLRARGVPARVSAGYALAEGNRGGGSGLMIRGQDAHAWPEIYLRGIGWVVVDLTPEQVLDATATAPDQALQQTLGEMLRQSPEYREWLEETATEWPTWREILTVLAQVLAVLLVLAYAVKLYRRLAPRLAGGSQIHRLGYRAVLDQLVEVGLRRRHGESRELFARRGSELAPSFAELTGEHLGWALGSRRTAPPEAVGRLVERAGEELNRAIPLWRRALGALDPTSWLRVR